MKIMSSHSIKSVTLTFLTALLIFSFLVMAVETFMHLDSFMTGDLSILNMAHYAALSLSNYFIMLSAISLLFSITYFLSNLSANNELIALFTAGFSKRRILRPLIVLSFALTLGYLVFSESGLLLWKTECEIVSQEYFGLSGTQDARRSVLYDSESGYLIFADRYSESYQRLYSPILIKTEEGRVIKRVEADYADYDESGWTFYNATVIEEEDSALSGRTHSTYIDDEFLISEELFRSQNLNMETMEARAAYEYLNRLYSVNRMAWQESATDFISRLADPIGILVLAIIAMSMNYNYKKNILLFTIVQSLSIAVVYYVAEMVFSIASRQGAISPYSLIYVPSIITIALSYVLQFLSKRI